MIPCIYVYVRTLIPPSRLAGDWEIMTVQVCGKGIGWFQCTKLTPKDAKEIKGARKAPWGARIGGRWAPGNHRGARWSQEGPRGAQEEAKMGQDGSKMAQNDFKGTSRWSKRDPEKHPRRSQRRPKWIKMGSKDCLKGQDEQKSRNMKNVEKPIVFI